MERGDLSRPGLLEINAQPIHIFGLSSYISDAALRSSNLIAKVRALRMVWRRAHYRISLALILYAIVGVCKVAGQGEPEISTASPLTSAADCLHGEACNHGVEPETLRSRRLNIDRKLEPPEEELEPPPSQEDNENEKSSTQGAPLEEVDASNTTTPLLPTAPSPESSDEADSDKSTANVDSTVRIESSVEAKESSIRIFKVQGMGPSKAVCHIQGVCRSGDGQFLLPHWMEKYDAQIDSCGLPGKVRYVLHETKKDSDVLEVSAGHMDKGPSTVWSIEGLRRKKLTLTGDYSGHDLIGGKAPRELMHWMVTDLTPSFYLMDMAARTSRYIRYGRFTSEKCFQSGGESCTQQDSPPKLNPLVLVDIRVSEKKSHQWPKGVLRLMRNAFRGDLAIADAQEIYGWQVRSKAACFRSIFSTSARVADFSENLFTSSHIMWKANGLSRDSVIREKKEGKENTVSPCTSRVLLLNKYGKRYMVGHEKLHAAIAKTAQAEVEQNFPSIRVLSETVFFEKSSFHEQVSVMQESRIVVASHGSSSANIVFLRPGSTFIEVMPFGLEVDTYSNLAKAFGIKYTAVMAQPDEEVFTSCVEHFNPGNPVDVAGTVKEWKRAAEEFRTAAVDSHVNPTTKFRISNGEDAGEDAVKDDHFRECASYQRLSFNVDRVAKLVVVDIMKQCGATDSLFLKK